MRRTAKQAGKRLALEVVLAAVLSTALLAQTAVAAPMGFKNSWMTMADFSPNWQEALLNYAVSPRAAVGASTLFVRSDDGLRSRQLTEANYTHLLQRWNLPDAQANVWFIGGLGSVSGNDFVGARTMASPGLQVDFETRRVYASVLGRLYRADGINHDYLSARAGFSFYETDYDEIQPWFIVEARRMNDLSERTEVTPMLRLIHKSYFVELGANNTQQGRVNFMYIF